MKALWKNSDNDVGGTIEKEFLPNGISPGKVPLRECICHHRYCASSWARVFRQERPPLLSPNPAHLEVTARGTCSNQMLGVAQPGQVIASPLKSFDRFKRLNLISPFQEIGPGSRHAAARRLA